MTAEMKPPKRVFIVGCPRSGTTFLQYSLASHADVLSLPETTFFDRILNHTGRWLNDEPALPQTRMLGLARGRAHRCAPGALQELATQLGDTHGGPYRHWRTSGYINHFVALLDRAANRHGRSVWIEKSPVHVAFIDLIEQHIPDALFIHVLRGGEDVVASILDVGLRYHAFERARGFDHWIPHWTRYWNRAIATHQRHFGRPRHCFVCQEDLAERYESESARILYFLGLDPNRRGEPALAISDASQEPWKRGALSTQAKPSERKVEALFGPQLRRWLREQLTPYAPVRAQVAALAGYTPPALMPRALWAARAR